MSKLHNLTVSALKIDADDVTLSHHDSHTDGTPITTIVLGYGHVTITAHVEGDTARDQLTNARLIAARIDELALAEITKINRAEYTALPLEDVDEGEFLDAWGITPGDLGDLASLERTDPGDEPIVIDVDGTEVAA